MSASHDELKAEAAAYLLGSLDADTWREFEAHLAQCPECVAEVRALREVTDALAVAVPQLTPRAELRARVLDSFAHDAASRASGAGTAGKAGEASRAGEAGAASSAGKASRAARTGITSGRRGGPSGPPEEAGKRPGTTHSWWPVAASMLLTLAVGAYAVRLNIRVADLEVRLEQAALQASTAERSLADARRATTDAQSAMAVLVAPDLARIDLAGQAVAPDARARALWSRANGMVFTASNLPAPPEGRVYQVWVVTTASPISAGLLMTDASGRSMAFFNTPPDIGAPVAVAVTLEPAGGVPAPTGERYLIGMPGPTL